MELSVSKKRKRKGEKKKKGEEKKPHIDIICADILWCIVPVVDSWVSQRIAGQLSQATEILRASMRQITNLSPPDITQLHLIPRAAYLLSREDTTEICNLNQHQQQDYYVLSCIEYVTDLLAVLIWIHR